MRNAGNKKLLAVLLALTLLACSVMALGSTLASQVDQTKGTGESVDGSYDVSVTYCDTGVEYSKIFLTETAFTKNVPWCPGYTKVIYLKVENNESFPMECTLDFEVVQNGFDNMMTYAVIALNSDPMVSDALRPSSWTNFLTAASGEKSLQTSNPHYIFNEVSFLASDTRYYAIAFHMSENTTNAYQNKQLEMKFNFRVDSLYKPDGTQN